MMDRFLLLLAAACFGYGAYQLGYMAGLVDMARLAGDGAMSWIY